MVYSYRELVSQGRVLTTGSMCNPFHSAPRVRSLQRARWLCLPLMI